MDSLDVNADRALDAALDGVHDGVVDRAAEWTLYDSFLAHGHELLTLCGRFATESTLASIHRGMGRQMPRRSRQGNDDHVVGATIALVY